MGLSTIQDWIAWAGVVLPLASLAWAAVAWVRIERSKVEQREFENFHRLLLRIHNQDKSLISQTAAVFELRMYPRYEDFIRTLCANPHVFFGIPLNPVLQEEIKRTADFFQKV